MAVSGNADIFSIKVDSRLKTTLIHTGVAPEMNFSSVFIQKFISSPKCSSGSVAGEGKVICQISPNHPLKLVNLAAIFTGKLSLYQRMILYRAGPLEGYFRNFNFRGGGAPNTTPEVEDVRYVIILLT